MQLTFEKGMATVKTENAIRKVLSPTKRTLGEPIYLQRKGAEAMTGNAMPADFFAVKEMKTRRKADGRGTLRRRKRAWAWTEPVWREISCGAGENGGGNYRMLFSGDEGGEGAIKEGPDFLSEKSVVD